MKSKTHPRPAQVSPTESTVVGPAPELGGIFESALYTEDLAAADRFYGDVLGLEKIFFVAGRQLVFRSQDSILLIFNSKRTSTERTVINGGAIPLHGTTGAGHVAFRVTKKEMETWRERFHQIGVDIESEVTWPNGAHSIYFRDPAGNSLELATPDLWASDPTGQVA